MSEGCTWNITGFAHGDARFTQSVKRLEEDPSSLGERLSDLKLGYQMKIM